MRAIVILVLIIALSACNEGTPGTASASGVAMDLANYTLSPIPGSDVQYARKGAENAIEEEGMIRNGKKEGTWVTYFLEALHIPQKVASYSNGKLNGYYAEFNSRGQLELSAVYKNGVLHGRYATYKYGNLTEQRFYKDNQLHGMLTTYYPNTKNLQKEINYKNGKEDGFYRYYNEQGVVTLEYEYKNGEKIGGGMTGQ